MTFDPFESRLCRDVRNATGTALIRSLQAKDTGPFDAVLGTLEADTLPPSCRQYVNNRKKHLGRLLSRTPKGDPDTLFFITARQLWDARLYFELHEWLEKRWAVSSGKEKKCLQALIRAAVALEQYEYGRTGPAQKLAAKAVQGMASQAEILPAVFDAGKMLETLERIAAL